MEGRYGHIRYRCRVTVERPAFRRNLKAKKAFSVFRCLELNSSLLCAALPIEVESSEDVGRILSKGIVQIKAHINQRGFVPGDYINVDVDFSNRSSVDITKIELSLLKRVRYHAYRNGQIIAAEKIHHATARRIELEETVCKQAEVEQNVLILSGSSGIISRAIRVPEHTKPTLNSCHIISANYFVKVINRLYNS
ncbi:hypothetical protein PFISCL1PPCAC_8929, partial [Pristionchus fissidentatus]